MLRQVWKPRHYRTPHVFLQASVGDRRCRWCMSDTAPTRYSYVLLAIQDFRTPSKAGVRDLPPPSVRPPRERLFLSCAREPRHAPHTIGSRLVSKVLCPPAPIAPHNPGDSRLSRLHELQKYNPFRRMQPKNLSPRSVPCEERPGRTSLLSVCIDIANLGSNTT